jgi:hypothetical protein
LPLLDWLLYCSLMINCSERWSAKGVESLGLVPFNII